MARIGKFFFFDGSENLATVFYYHVRSNGGVVESIGCVDNTPSFLEQSSFLLSPSGYKEDTVYTQKPIGATGNLTFTRGSDAWRTNVQGLVQRTPYNLLQRSEEFDNGIWTKTGCTISTNVTSAPNGTTTADKLVSTNLATGSSVYQQGTIIANASYTFSIYVKASGANWIQLIATGTTISSPARLWVDLSNGALGTNNGGFSIASVTNVGDGWYRVSGSFTMSSTATFSNLFCALATGDNINAFSGDGTSGVYIWGAQLVEGVDPLPYFPTTDRLNVSRLDYTYGTCPALLLEPQRTNLVLQSQDFDNASWTKVGLSVSANTTTSPDGNTNADTLTSTATSGVIILQTPTIVSGTTYSTTFYAKQNTQRFVYIRFTSNASNQNYVSAVFDLQDGTLGETSVGTTSGTLVSATATSSANGFYRITVIASISRTDGNVGVGFASAKTGNTFNNFGAITSAITSGNSFFAYGAQLEVGAYPSSYIKTEATTVTRLADSFSRNNIYTNNLITSAGGTWYVELRNNIPYTRDGFGALYLGTQLLTTSTTGDGFLIRRNDTSLARLTVQSYIAGSGTSLYITQTDTVKIAIKWNGTTCDVFHNGTKQVSGASFTPTAMEFLGHTTIVDVPKFIQSMALFNYPLSDSDCQLLTT